MEGLSHSCEGKIGKDCKNMEKELCLQKIIAWNPFVDVPQELRNLMLEVRSTSDAGPKAEGVMAWN